jgi:hypothetical protein
MKRRIEKLEAELKAAKGETGTAPIVNPCGCSAYRAGAGDNRQIASSGLNRGS